MRFQILGYSRQLSLGPLVYKKKVQLQKLKDWNKSYIVNKKVFAKLKVEAGGPRS